jgi:hypothetical protein
LVEYLAHGLRRPDIEAAGGGGHDYHLRVVGELAGQERFLGVAAREVAGGGAAGGFGLRPGG